MKALVTGATGFIGSNLVKRLRQQGWSVNLLVRPKGDLANIASLRKAVAKVDVVFHLAAALPHHHLTDQEYWQTNVVGTRNLLEVCRRVKIKRFVHVSTVGIYDQPPTVYSKTKKKAEQLARSCHQKYKLPTVIIRPTIAYGPGDTRPGFLNLFRLIQKGTFIPIGKGSNYFHTIYIGNLLDVFLLAATNQRAIGKALIIGDHPVPTMHQILAEMFTIANKSYPSYYIPTFLAKCIAVFFDFAQKLGLRALLPSQRVRFMTENRKYDISQAVGILKWKPKVGLAEGLKTTYAWYQKAGLL